MSNLENAPIENKFESMKKIAQENFSLWAEAVSAKDVEKTLELYDTNNLSFLPTLSGELKTDHQKTEEYFKHFLEKNPSPEIIEEKVQILGEDCYLHSGIYNFEVGEKDNREIVEARFSFVWRKGVEGWKIIHHHSSLKPKK